MESIDFFHFAGNEIIDLLTQENDIYSENVHRGRITVDTDYQDGLISRYSTFCKFFKSMANSHTIM